MLVSGAGIRASSEDTRSEKPFHMRIQIKSQNEYVNLRIWISSDCEDCKEAAYTCSTHSPPSRLAGYPHYPSPNEVFLLMNCRTPVAHGRRFGYHDGFGTAETRHIPHSGHIGGHAHLVGRKRILVSRADARKYESGPRRGPICFRESQLHACAQILERRSSGHRLVIWQSSPSI